MMIQKIWIWLLIPIVLAVPGCGENTAENYSAQDESSIAASDLWDDAYPETDDGDSQTGGAKDTADSADVRNAMNIADGADAGGVRDTADSADAEDTTESSENISMEEDFSMKYKTGGQFYEDSFLSSMTSALGEDGEKLFSYEDLPSGIFFSSYTEWENFWNSYPDTVDKEYEALYDETYFEEHQLIWFYLEVWNNLCSVDVEETHYDAESGCIVMDVSWGEDPERGSIDMCMTYIVANFVEIQGKYPLRADTKIEMRVTQQQ